MTVRKRDFLAGGLVFGAGLMVRSAIGETVAGRAPAALAGVKAILFDLFGTVVDWRGSLIRELATWGRSQNLRADWAKFAEVWYAAYRAGTDEVRTGKRPWTGFEPLLAVALDQTLPAFPGLGAMTVQQKMDIAAVWRQLDPWPDAVPGLSRLKAHYLIAPLANASVPALLFMAKRKGLPWDNVFSGDYLRHYAPDPKTYAGAADLLQLKPAQVMLASAHTRDLDVAFVQGLKTAYVPRLEENGPRTVMPDKVFLSVHRFDVVATDLGDLARQMGT